MPYSIPATTTQTKTVIKKSRFIARAGPATDREQAMALLTTMQQDFPDSNHYCWGYLLGSPTSAHSAAMSDDGEPPGTAGKPILNVLNHKDVGDVMVIVTRYFGGVKLGAGGLVRAYSAAAQQVMEQLPTKIFEVLTDATITLDFSQEQTLRHWLSQHQAKLINIDYQASVICHIQLSQANVQALIDYGQGQGWQIQLPNQPA